MHYCAFQASFLFGMTLMRVSWMRFASVVYKFFHNAEKNQL